MGGDGIKEKIIKLLSRHDYGLTIEDVARSLEINRMTASKYLAILEATRKIAVREVGKAKLHYPKANKNQKWLKLNNYKSSCGLNSIGFVFLLFLFFTAIIFFSAVTTANPNGGNQNFEISVIKDYTEKLVILEIQGPPLTDFSLTLINPENKSISPKDNVSFRTDQEGEYELQLIGFVPGDYMVILESNGTEYTKDFGIEDFVESECNRTFLEYRAENATNVTETNESVAGEYVWDICRNFVESSVTEELISEIAENRSFVEEELNVTEIIENRTFVESENVTNETIERSFVEEELNITEIAENRTFLENESAVNETVINETLERSFVEQELNITEIAENMTFVERELNITNVTETNESIPRLFIEKIVEFLPEKKKFAMNEKPKFKFTLKKIFSERGRLIEEFAEPEVLNVFVYGPDQKLLGIKTDILKLGSGEYEIELSKGRAFRPGLYRIRMEVKEGNETYEMEDQFLWGVLAVNTHKSIYLENEQAFIGIAVLDDQGRMVCDADVTLEITDPHGTKTTLTTSDGTINVSPECEFYGVTNLPDYYAYYTVNTEGTYTMNLKAITRYGERTMADTFEVRKQVDFDVEREGPTRIYPPAKYQMISTIKANKNYDGEINEYVPSSFVITPQQGLAITTTGDTKTLTWNKKLIAGETYQLAYEFDAPDVSPYLFTLGALEIGGWKEAREWMIASDTPGLREVNMTLTEDVDIYKSGGSPSSQHHYVYIEFDISSLPDYSTITYNNATLTLTRSQTANDEGNIDVYRVNDQSCDVANDDYSALDGYAINNLTQFVGLGLPSGGQDVLNITDIFDASWQVGDSKLCVRLQAMERAGNPADDNNSKTATEMNTGEHDGSPARFWYTKQGTTPAFLTVRYDDSQNPNASLGTNPSADYSNGGTFTFDLKCTDNDEPNTLQLWGNWSGGWSAKETNSSPVNDTFWNVTVSGIAEGSWKWGVYCNDSAGNGDWSDTNRTFTSNLGPKPTNVAATPQKAKNATTVNISATVTDSDGVSVVRAMVDYPNGTFWQNVTMTKTGDVYWNNTVTANFDMPDRYNVTIWANDTGNRINSSETTWFAPYLNLSKEKNITINGSFTDWSDVTSVSDNGTDAGVGGPALDNEVLITGLNDDEGNLSIFSYNNSTKKYELNWSDDTADITTLSGTGGEIGDVNHDGVNDFVIARSNGTTYLIEVWTYNSSSQEWYRLWLYNTGNSNPVWFGDIGDFDNDGKNEFLISRRDNGNHEIWGNDTEGATSFSFNATVLGCGASTSLYHKAAGDLDGDTVPELFLQCGADTNISIFEWNGTDYDKITEVEPPLAAGSTQLMLIDDMECNGDVDRDTVDECVFCGNSRKSHVLDYSGGTYSVVYNSSSESAGNTQTCSIGDITNDGWPDWFDASRDGVRVFSYNGTDYENVWNSIDPGWTNDPAPGASFAGDSDNDDRNEFIHAGPGSGPFDVWLWENNTDNATSFNNTFNWTNAARGHIIIGDLDSDAGAGGGGADFDITNMSLANNDTYLFARIGVNGSIDVSEGDKYYRMFISTDDSVGNETSPENEDLPFKYDYRVQVNGSLCYVFNYTDYSINVSSCLFNYTGGQMEIGVNLSVLGLSTNDNANISFQTGSTNPGGYDSAPDGESFLSYDVPGAPGDTSPTASLGTNPVPALNDSDGSIVFDLKCSDDNGVSVLELWGNWSGWHANETNSSPGNDAWWNVTVSGIPEGMWKWDAWCNDTMGQGDWSAVNRTFTVDLTNPTASMGTNPVDYINDSDGSIVFDLKCSDNFAPDVIQLWGNWSGWHANETNSTPLNDTFWNKTVPGIPAGTYKWGVYCNDSSGREDWSTNNRTLTIDLTDPQIGNKYINESGSVSPDTIVCLNVSGVSDTYLDTVWTTVNQSNGSVFNVTMLDDGDCAGIADDGWYSADVNVGNSAGTFYYNTTYVNDSSGRMNSNTTELNLTVQAAGDASPTASLGTNPVAYLNDSDGSITFDLKCSDDNGVSVLELWGNWSGWHANETNSTPVNDTFWNVTVNGIPEGVWKWDAWCNDTIGQGDWSDVNRTFTVDLTNPNASLGTNPVDYVNDSDGSLTFDLKCSDNFDVATLQLWGNWSGSWEANQTNSTPQNNTFWNVTVSGIPQGTWRWGVYCNDSVGREDWSDSNRTLTSTAVTNCTDITSSGTYNLIQDIPDSPETYCINISASDVTFDCQGYYIQGPDSATNYGIYAKSTPGSEYDNITIKNCNVTDWRYGVYLWYSDNGSVQNVTASNNNYAGVYLSSADNNNLTNITANLDGTYGVYLTLSDNNNLVNITANDQNYGLYISGDSNTLTNITGKDNSAYGLYLRGEGNQLTDITVLDNSDYDFSIFASNAEDCDNLLTNVIGTDNKPIVYYNDSVTIEDWNNNASMIVLCDADNSVINNVTMYHTGVENNGIVIFQTSSANITNINVYDVYIGLFIRDSSNNQLANITANSNTEHGFSILDSDNNNLTNITANSNTEHGLWINTCDNNTFTNITANSNSEDGFHFHYDSDNNNITNITANSNDHGVYFEGDGQFLWSSDNNILANSRMEDNSQRGIRLVFAGKSAPNKIYNNLFNNTNNFWVLGSAHCTMYGGNQISCEMDFACKWVGYCTGKIWNNTWNTTEQAGVRIYSNGTNIGGNYWTNPSGTGFSDDCDDDDYDGFCDVAYNLTDGNACTIGVNCSGNADYLPYSDGYVPPVPPANIVVKTYTNSYYNETDKFYTRNETIFTEANVTNSSGGNITDATVTANFTTGGSVKNTTVLTKVCPTCSIYRGNWTTNGTSTTGVYLVNVTASNAAGSKEDNNSMHLYSGSGVSAYEMDWDADGTNDYVMENKHVISVFNKSAENTNRLLSHVELKDTNVSFTFSDTSDTDSSHRGFIGTDGSKGWNFTNLSFTSTGEDLTTVNLTMNAIDPPADSGKPTEQAGPNKQNTFSIENPETSGQGIIEIITRIFNELVSILQGLFRSVIPEQEPKLSSLKTYFTQKENPEFVFEIPEAKEMVESIEVDVYHMGKPVEIEPEVEVSEQGKLSITVPRARKFRPGLYTIKLTHDGETHGTNFLWGVLAINTHKSIYLENEEAFIGVAVLDNEGHMVCNANVTLEITDPNGTKTKLATSDGTIQISHQCEFYGVTNLPDYYAYYTVSTEGTYTMNLKAITRYGERTMTDAFLVQKQVDFDVERDGPTRIYPPSKYTMTFEIKANKDFEGEINEYVPTSFAITPQQGLTINTIGDAKTLTWNRKLTAGETYQLAYEFDAPDVSPYLFTLGALEIGNWKEAREWMVASDTPDYSGRTCSETWGFSCGGQDDDTFDTCLEGGTCSNHNISEVYLNSTSILTTDWIEVKCEFYCDNTADFWAIIYKAPGGSWTENASGFCAVGWQNQSTNINPENVEGEHQVRCIVDDDAIEPPGTCATDGGGGPSACEFDNDDANFTVEIDWPPTWSNPDKNDTIIYTDDYVKFNTTWNDTIGLSGYIFSLKQGSDNWVNSSFTSFSGLGNVSENISKITASATALVQWRFWANDTGDKWNVTDTQQFTVANPLRVIDVSVTPQKAKNATSINITANITDLFYTPDVARAMLYYPNGSFWQNATMANNSEIYYNDTVTVDFDPPDRYNVTIWANNSNGDVNSTETTWFAPYLNLSQEKNITINGSFTDWSGVTSVSDNGTDAGGEATVDNELLIVALNNDFGNMTIFTFNETGSDSYEDVWSDADASTDWEYCGGEVGDVNHDGKNDFVITDDEAADNMEVWSYNASSGEWYEVWRSSSVIDFIGDIADFDDDGKNEILVSDGTNDDVEIWGNDTVNATTFSLNATILTDDNCNYHAAGGDMDGDGVPEIVTQCSGEDVRIWEWNGTDYENLQNVTLPDGKPAAGTVIDDMECGDLDRDTDDECVLCGNTGMSSIIDYVGGTYKNVYNSSATPGTGGDNHTKTCSIGDVTNDGWPDWFDAYDDGVRVYSYNGTDYENIWNYVTTDGTGIGCSGAGDADNDGYVEFLVYFGTSDKHMLWENDTEGASGFSNTFNFSTTTIGGVIIGDLDTNGSSPGNDPDFDITNVSLAHNDTYLFARIAVNGSIDVSEAANYYRVFISTNDSVGNETSPENEDLPFKYDYRVQVNGSACYVFNYTDYGSNVSSCFFNGTGDQMEIGVNLSVINLSAGENANITFQTGSTNPGGYDSAPDGESFLSYDVPSGETPPTASLGTNPIAYLNDSDGSIVFDLKCSDDNGADVLELWGNWSGWHANETNSSPVNNVWWNKTVSGIAEGVWKWDAWCNDTTGQGDWSAVNRTFTVDLTNPTASMGTNPVDYVNDSDGSITFDLKCSDNFSPDTLQLWGNWSGTWEANQTNSTPLDDTFWNKSVPGIPAGIYKWGVYCNDSSGREDWSTNNRTLTIDLTDPQIGSKYINESGSVSINTIVCLNVSGVSDNIGVDTIWTTVTQSNGSVFNITMSDTGSCAGSPGDNWYSADVNVGDSSGTFYYNTTYVNDSSGRINSNTTVLNLTVDPPSFNVTIEMRSEDVDYLVYHWLNFPSGNLGNLWSDVSGRLGSSVGDDRYHVGDGTDLGVEEASADQWTDYTTLTNKYIAVYDNSTTTDPANNTVLGWVHFKNTSGADYEVVSIWNESEKYGTRIKYNLSSMANSDKVVYLLVFSNGTWNTIDKWMSTINSGLYPTTNFMSSPGAVMTALGSFTGPSSIDENETTTYMGNCTCSGGSCDDPWIRIQDNRTGTWSNSVTSHENVSVNVTSYSIAGPLSGTSGNYHFNVTGNSSGHYNFRAVCNTTSATEDPSDASLLIVSACNVDFTMSSELQVGILFSEQDPDQVNVSAVDNGDYNVTDDSNSGCGTVNVSVRATSNLINGSSVIGIGNVTVNSTSPDSETIQLSTTYQLIRSSVPAGTSNITTLYFWLTIPSEQDPKAYNTTIYVKEEME